MRGNGETLLRRSDTIFRISAAGQQRANGIAYLPARVHLRSYGGNVAGDLKPQNLRDSSRGRVMAAALQEIGSVEPRRGNTKQKLIRCGLRSLGLADRELISFPRRGYQNCSHN